MSDLELEHYDVLFASRRIRTGTREISPGTASRPLYRQILGDAWSALPEPIKAMHDRSVALEARGVARVERGRSRLSAAVARAFGFPRASDSVPMAVSFEPRGDEEIWRRTFDRQSFSSSQARGSGRSEGLLSERFGPFVFDMALVVDGGRLAFIVRRWGVFGLTLPAFLAPTGNSYEFAADGRFHFHVEIGHSWTGLIVRYSGWLIPLASAHLATTRSRRGCLTNRDSG